MTKGKKLWLSVIILLCAAIALTAFAACDPAEVPNGEGHDHKWSAEWTVDVDPTCTAKGSKSHHCTVLDCNEKNDITEIAAKGHGTLVKHDEVANSCVTAGAEEYWECPDCHVLYSDAAGEHQIAAAVVIPAAHKLVHHDEAAKSCTAAGAEEYWECSACHKLYSDEACEHQIDAVVVIPAGHTLVHHDETDKSCTTAGAEEYWECSVCHKLYSDEACEHEIEEPQAIPASHGTLEYHAKVDNACDVDGAVQYWECPDCHKMYSDEACENEISTIVIPAKGHGSLVHHAAVVATCLMGGAEEYWECPVCNRFYSDEECVHLIEQAVVLPVDPTNHDGGVRAVAEVPATCTESGVAGYYRCAFCSKLYSDAACENEILFAASIPAQGHDFDEEWTIDVEATCMDDGSKSHHCQNAGCNEKTDVTVVEARGHHGEAVAVAAYDGNNRVDGDSITVTTISKDSNYSSIKFNRVAHYICPDCGKKFSDEALTKEVTVVYSNSGRYGNLLDLGNNIVFAHSGAYSCFSATANGYYNISVNEELTILLLSMILETNESVYGSSKWNENSNAYSRFTEHPTTLGNAFCLYLIKGECIIFRASNKEYNVLVERVNEPLLDEGQNTVEITTANDALGVDSYKFVPTETKTYSLRVPAGMTVAMDDKSFISSGDYANFKATAGVAIKFSFSHSVTGEYQIEIGDAILPVMTLGVAIAVTEYPGLGETFSFVLDESIEEGEYILTATGITRESFYVAINLEGEIVMSGSNIEAQDGWLYYTMGQTNKKVTLKGGDIITLINPVSGTAAKTISFTLTKAN